MQFANLALDTYKPLPRSPVREIDDQTSAMKAMHTALSQFGQYVPRELVRRLLQSGTEATRSVEREITAMFTHVAGFTAMSEHMNAADVVRLLNEHFDLLCEQISGHQCTVDKFMGDGLTAFRAPRRRAKTMRDTLSRQRQPSLPHFRQATIIVGRRDWMRLGCAWGSTPDPP